MAIVTKEIKIDTRLFESISMIAKRENTTEDKVLNKIIENGLNVEYAVENVPDFLEMGGVFTTDEPFSAVEDKRKLRTGEL